MAEVRVDGLDDLRRAVEELTADLRRRVVIGALKDAARPIVLAARAAAPVKTGLLRSHVGVYTSKIYKGQGGVIGVMIRVRPAKKHRVKGTRVRVVVKQDDPYYAKFLLKGTKKMAKRDFLTPAASAGWPAALEIFKAKLAERITKANRRK